MNEFKENLTITTKGKGNSTSAKLRELADKIDAGGYVSEPTIQRLEKLLTVAIHEKSVEERLGEIQHWFEEELGE